MFSRTSAAGARHSLHIRAKSDSPSTAVTARITRTASMMTPAESSSAPLVMMFPRSAQPIPAAIATKTAVTTRRMSWMRSV